MTKIPNNNTGNIKIVLVFNIWNLPARRLFGGMLDICNLFVI